MLVGRTQVLSHLGARVQRSLSFPVGFSWISLGTKHDVPTPFQKKPYMWGVGVICLLIGSIDYNTNIASSLCPL